MKVRIDTGHPDAHFYDEFLEGETYLVVGIERGRLRVVGRFRRPFLYPRDLFEVVDDWIPEDWVTESATAGEETLGPAPFLEVGFYEDFFDGDKQVKAKVFAYLEELRGRHGESGD